MFTSKQYRAKEEEYRRLGANTHVHGQIREFKALERAFAELAANEEWLAKNFDKIVRPPETPADEPGIAESEEHAFACLGAADDAVEHDFQQVASERLILSRKLIDHRSCSQRN